MPRGTHNPSEVFSSVIDGAQKSLLLNSEVIRVMEHNGIKGDERAAALKNFIQAYLPDRFSICKGEIIDYRDNRSGQIDILIYDSHTSAPVLEGSENQLIPAEALYAVIEVKTTLTLDELKTCFVAADKIRSLRPFKKFFVPPRTDGAAADDHNPRYLYSVFSYFSNLGQNDWLQKEYDRIVEAAAQTGADLDTIDRVIVLNRGFVLPDKHVGKEEIENAQSIFMDFYLHLMNFLSRESKRRDPIDWQLYGARNSPGWKKLA